MYFFLHEILCKRSNLVPRMFYFYSRTVFVSIKLDCGLFYSTNNNWRLLHFSFFFDYRQIHWLITNWSKWNVDVDGKESTLHLSGFENTVLRSLNRAPLVVEAAAISFNLAMLWRLAATQCCCCSIHCARLQLIRTDTPGLNYTSLFAPSTTYSTSPAEDHGKEDWIGEKGQNARSGK